MARNEEKQLGKLNRLWLQKEREDGRIKDVIQPRPKLATLNSVAAVKKWIPSIKNEIEYYLQQSQLSHYPERKIAEFQQQIEQLEKEYKRYLNKLRSLDPTCKEKPWMPRAYTKRRSDSDGYQCIAKKRCHPDSGSQDTHEERAVVSTPNKQEPHNPSVSCVTAPPDLPDQDLPLSFDRTKLAVVTAVCHDTSSVHLQDTGVLAHVLRNGLPNLHSSPAAPVTRLQEKTETKNVPNTELTRESKKDHVLGLGQYSSSSDEET